MVDSGIRTRHLRLPNRGDTCTIQDTNSADLNSAGHGQFQDKEKNADYWIEYFLFKKNFSTENNKVINEFRTLNALIRAKMPLTRTRNIIHIL